MPTYFEMFALEATLFSSLDSDGQKEERGIAMTNDTWTAAMVATMGDAWII